MGKSSRPWSYMTPNAQMTEEKTDEFDLSELKLLCIKGHQQESEKTTLKKGENIGKSYIQYPGYIKNSYNSTLKRTTTQFLKWAKRMQTLPKGIYMNGQ